MTGIAGFVGSRLATALIERGDTVLGIDDLSSGFRENLPRGAQMIVADIADPIAIKDAFQNVDVVFHQAARRSVAKSVDDPVLTDRSNTLGTLNVLMAAHAAGVKRVVYASSSSVYGDPPQPLRIESQSPEPISPYAVSKLAGEQYCRVWTSLHGLSTVSLRYFNVYGPGQHRESKYALVFPAFVHALLDGRAPQIDWDGEQSRDFTYIDDIVSANLAAASAPEEVSGEVFNIASGKAHTVNEALKAVSDAAGIWIDPEVAPKRPGDVRATLADIEKARALLSWEPKTDWETSVAACVDWFRSSHPA